MNLHQNYRAQYPDAVFKTRALHCSDGTTRMISLAVWYWDKLDILLDVDTPSLDDITGFCLELAHRSVDEEGWEFDHAFYELLMYYIYRNYSEYVQFIHNIANDDKFDCFAE